MGAPSKRAKKIRVKSEFDLVRLAAAKRPMIRTIGAFAWSIDAIKSSRGQQVIGNFRDAARLAQAMKTDGAIFSALQNRLAPQQGLPRVVVPRSQSAAALRVASEADALFGPKGVGVSRGTLVDINEQMAMHGVGFGVNVFTPRPDGSRVDVELKCWPIDCVWWNATRRCFQTSTENEGTVDIVHGDGRWVIFTNHEVYPWMWGALLPLAVIWADRAFGIRDRSQTGTSHGNAKTLGEMPEGVAIEDADGNLTDEAAALAEVLRTFAADPLPYGLIPSGAKVSQITNATQAWQIFDSIINSNAKDANSVLVGQNGIADASSGNYVKAEMLFGVTENIVESDLGALQSGLLTGTIEPWAAINYGDSSLAPDAIWQMPDADQDARRESIAKNEVAFYAALALAKQHGMRVDQPYVQTLADRYGISPVPVLVAAATASTPSQPAAAPASAAPAAAPASPPKLAAV